MLQTIQLKMSVGFNASFRKTKVSLLNHAKTLIRFYAGTQENVKTKKYTDTILLPQTKFPVKLIGESRIEMDEYLAEVSKETIPSSEF